MWDESGMNGIGDCFGTSGYGYAISRSGMVLLMGGEVVGYMYIGR